MRSRNATRAIAAWSALGFFLLTPCLALAQAIQPAPQSDDKIVRLGVTLVQVDAIVTDRDGRPVTDLSKDDFELMQDDRPQVITNFSFVASSPPPATTREVSTSGPPVRLPPERVRRTIAIVVDDLASNESARAARDAVRSFVDNRLEPGDQIAIVQSRTGAGALQQFSANRDELYAAIERIRYVPRSRPEKECDDGTPTDINTADARGLAEALRTDVFIRGTLGVLNFVVRGLRELPGRKSVVLLSDGMPCALEDVDAEGPGPSRVRRAVQNLIDLANRGAVAIYSIDVRGVLPLVVSADEPTNRFRRLTDLGDRLAGRRSTLFRSRDVLSQLADQTGGLFIYNTNDITDGLRRAVDDQLGYYLLSYIPEESTFGAEEGRSEFHRISVRAKRLGVTVRARSGFYGYPDEEAGIETRSASQRMVDAVISPFSASGVRMQVTPLFSIDPRSGPSVMCLLHVDARDLTFTTERDDSKVARVDLVVVAFGDNGGMVSRQASTQEIRLRGDDYQRALRFGLDQTVTFPLKRAGAYSMRAAVRDVLSDRIGSAYQFIELPDVSNDELAMSGIVLSSDIVPVEPRALNRQQKSALADPPVSPAVRRFKGGDRVSYGFEIYNARRDKVTKRPSLEMTVRVYREGRLILSNAVPSFDPGPQADWSRTRVGRGLQLGEDMKPGSYVLEIVVRDVLGGAKARSASQWIDFDVE